MDYNKLIEKRDYVKENIDKLDKNILLNYQTDFDVEFIHNSTAIEGNTLTLIETKLLIEDKFSVGSKALREIYEIINHNKAWNYVKTSIQENKDLNEDMVKDLHSILMENIMVGGIYRTVEVRITGAKHTPPTPNDAYNELKNFFETLGNLEYNEFELAAYTHAEFVKIHPFVDGNGRTSRTIMNYQLLKKGFLPVSIKKENKLKYYEVLDEYAVNGNLKPFTEMLYDLEMEQLDFYSRAIKEVE